MILKMKRREEINEQRALSCQSNINSTKKKLHAYM